MKKTLVITLLFIFSAIGMYSQEINGTKITKELICRGAAVSVVGHVKPFFDLNRSKEEILQMTKELIKDPIKDAPAKAYDLFKAQKTKEEVIEILYKDFMKLDEETTLKFLINADPNDY